MIYDILKKQPLSAVYMKSSRKLVLEHISNHAFC